MSKTDTVLVRIKPYNPRRGYVLRRYVYADPKTGTRYRFEEPRGWYVVPVRIGNYLKTIHSSFEDPESPFAFDVVSQEEAKRIDNSEQVEEKPRATADRARSATDAKSAAVTDRRPADLDDGKGEANEGAVEASKVDTDTGDDDGEPDPLEEPEVKPRGRRRRGAE